MRQYKVEGETHKKVILFFLQAARYSELPMSTFLQKHIRTVAGRKGRSSAGPKPKGHFVGDMSGVADTNGSTGPTKKIDCDLA